MKKERISDKKKISEETFDTQSPRLNELPFKTFFEKSKAIILVVDPIPGKIIEANQAAIEFYGYSSKELTSLNINEEFIGFTDLIVGISLNEQKENKNSYSQKHRLKNGLIHDVEIYPSLIKTDKKTLLYIIVQDVTSRKKAIEALKESETKKLALLKLIPDLILVINSEGEITDLFTDSPDRLQIPPHKLLGKKYQYLFPEGMSKLLSEKITVTKETRDLQSFEYRYKKEQYNYVFEEVRVISGGNGEILIIIRDVTHQKLNELELKRAWEEAKEANRIKSIFLANISHEIRTPINAILGFSELLEGELKNSSHIKYIESIKTSSKSLLNLINDLLDLSKIEAGKMSIRYEDVDIRLLLAEIRNIFSIKLREKALVFKTEQDDTVPELILFDEMRLMQIFLNVIGNAIKFTENGKISVIVKAFNPRTEDSTSFIDLKIEILDTGIGIDEKYLDSIFDAFKQTDDLDNRKYGGTGLGLAITKRLVELLNGTIEVKSKHGVGSLFTLNFSNIEIQTNPRIKRPEETIFKIGYIRFNPAKVLLADNESINRELLKGIFKESDMTIYEAKNGSEAIELIKEHNPKVALLDLKMPVIGGMEVAQFIKSSDKFASIKTIGISTTPENYLSDERKVYLDDFISKPVNLSELLKKLSNFLPYENINKHDEFEKGDNRAKNLFERKTWDKLKIELKNRLLSISHTSSFNDFEDFAMLLIEKGNKYDYDELVKIGNRIYEASKCFDLETVQHQLYEFNVLVNKSKSEINDKSI